MAKKNKVVISEAYLNVLREKSELLDVLFDDGMLRIDADRFKEIAKLEKAYAKVDNTGDEPLANYLTVTTPAKARRPKGAG